MRGHDNQNGVKHPIFSLVTQASPDKDSSEIPLLSSREVDAALTDHCAVAVGQGLEVLHVVHRLTPTEAPLTKPPLIHHHSSSAAITITFAPCSSILAKRDPPPLTQKHPRRTDLCEGADVHHGLIPRLVQPRPKEHVLLEGAANGGKQGGGWGGLQEVAANYQINTSGEGPPF